MTVALAVALLLAGTESAAERRYPVRALVVSVDADRKAFVASCTEIPGYMEAMEMPFAVRDPRLLEGIEPSAIVDFTLVVEADDSYAVEIRPHVYQNFEQEPLLAKRLSLLERISTQGPPSPPPPTLGEPVADFTLTDQNRAEVRLSQFRGQVVALTFIYTTCPLPNYCLRLSNNFGRLQTRFEDRLGKDLVLLSVTFDPAHDTPEVLAEYAKKWPGSTGGWHFLTGNPPDVKRIARGFGLNFWPDEGTVTHALNTFVIGRDGLLKANLEGNQFTSQQLGDFVQGVLDLPRK